MEKKNTKNTIITLIVMILIVALSSIPLFLKNKNSTETHEKDKNFDYNNIGYEDSNRVIVEDKNRREIIDSFSPPKEWNLSEKYNNYASWNTMETNNNFEAILPFIQQNSKTISDFRKEANEKYTQTKYFDVSRGGNNYRVMMYFINKTDNNELHKIFNESKDEKIENSELINAIGNIKINNHFDINIYNIEENYDLHLNKIYSYHYIPGAIANILNNNEGWKQLKRFENGRVYEFNKKEVLEKFKKGNSSSSKTQIQTANNEEKLTYDKDSFILEDYMILIKERLEINMENIEECHIDFYNKGRSSITCRIIIPEEKKEYISKILFVDDKNNNMRVIYYSFLYTPEKQ